MTVSSSTRLGITLWTAGSDAFNRAQMSSSHIALESKVAGYQQGTSRPTASLPLEGFVYYNSTTGVVSYCDGASWVDLNSFAAPTSISVGGTDVEGVSASFSRADHVHGIAGFGSVVQLDGSSANGVASTFSRSDHIHSIGAGVITSAMLASGVLNNDISGNAATADYATVAGSAGPSTTAQALTPGRNISISGDVSSVPVLFDGSSDVIISVSVVDNSHTHNDTTIDGLDASSVTTGVFSSSRMPSGDAGAWGSPHSHSTASISGLNAADTSSGVFAAARIPDMAVGGDLSGTVSNASVADSSHAHGAVTKIFVQTTAPTTGMSTNDLWIAT